MSAECSVYDSTGKHKDTLIEQVKADRSIKVRNGHWEEPEDYQQADLMIVPNEGKTVNDILFSDQTPLWHRHNVMLSTIVGTNEDVAHETGVIYFNKWES